MRNPSEGAILEVWEAALEQHPIDRALTLAAAFSRQTREQLAYAPIGVRDSMLLRARERMFGTQLDTYAECPACAQSTEFRYAIEDLPLKEEWDADGVYSTVDGVRFRLPNSFDLATIARLTDVEEAERALLRRCVVGETGAVDEAALERVGAAMAERDPAGAIEFLVECPACGHSFGLTLDAESYLFRELTAYCKRVLAEVDTLARAYAWTERDILGLSPQRRAMYLEMAAGA
jgi:hypothetical protein